MADTDYSSFGMDRLRICIDNPARLVIREIELHAVDRDAIEPLPMLPPNFSAFMFKIAQQDAVTVSETDAVGERDDPVCRSASDEDVIGRAADQRRRLSP